MRRILWMLPHHPSQLSTWESVIGPYVPGLTALTRRNDWGNPQVESFPAYSAEILSIEHLSIVGGIVDLLSEVPDIL